MHIENVDESLAREIDDRLQNEYDKVDVLRRLFENARYKAQDLINEQLKDLKIKRTAGLGTMFGPNDQQLFDAKGDKSREQKIVDETLSQKFLMNFDDFDKDVPMENPKKIALINGLATVLVRIFPTRANISTYLDKCSQFCSREKSLKSRLMSKNRKTLVRGHHLVLHQYYEVSHCNHCQNLIWGVGPQGYQCADCELNIHRPCAKVLEENCPGPINQKQQNENNNKFSRKIMDKIRTNSQFQSKIFLI